jgi:hypothetical protein
MKCHDISDKVTNSLAHTMYDQWYLMRANEFFES